MGIEIKQFKVNAFTVFGGHAESARDRLEEAHALSLLLGDVCLESGDTFSTLNEHLQRSTLRGISSLIAYAQFHLDAAYAEEEAAKEGAAK